MKVYGIYDMKNKEQCIIIGTLHEVLKYFGVPVPVKSLNRVLHCIGARYKLVYLFDEI